MVVEETHPKVDPERPVHAPRRPLVGPWDRAMARKSLLLSMACACVTFAVGAVTDEGGVPWAVRLGRALPALPVAAALGSFLTLRGARSRGEVRALEATGRPPWQSGLGAAAGPFLFVVIVAVGLWGAPGSDFTGFFPMARHADTFVREGDGFVDGRRTFRVAHDGSIVVVDQEGVSLPALRESAIPPHGRFSAAASTVLVSLALVLVATRTRPLDRRDAAVSLAMALAAIVLFHAAAAGRTDARLVLLPPVALTLWAVLRYRADP